MHFYPFCWTAWQPYRLSYILGLKRSFFYLPKDHFLKFWWKNVQNWWIWKIDLFWNNKIPVIKIQKNFIFLKFWILVFCCFKKSQFFKSTNSEHFFTKISGNYFFFAVFLFKCLINSWVSWIWFNFYDYSDFQQKLWVCNNMRHPVWIWYQVTLKIAHTLLITYKLLLVYFWRNIFMTKDAFCFAWNSFFFHYTKVILVIIYSMALMHDGIYSM